MNLVSAIDFHLLDMRSRTIHGRRRGLLEFVYFGIKNARACRFVGLFDPRIEHHPPYWMAATIAILVCLNFFSHYLIGDYRWYLAACALGLYARTTVIFRPLERNRRMPLMLSFVLIGFFIWLAENIGTFRGVWRYPNQLGAWPGVEVGKWSSWSLLVIMTFTIGANLKHIKSRIHLSGT
jgi:uncharacterized membrane protein YoaT (DUF817 family)